MRRLRVSVVAFYLFLTGIILTEGLGLRGGREVVLLAIVSAPFFLITLDILQGRIYSFPKFFLLLSSFFLLSTLMSTVFSVDTLQSIRYSLYYFSVIGIFIYVYNHKEEILPFINKFILFTGFIFISSSILIWIIWSINQFNLFPIDGYQFIYKRWSSHSHLGDYLLLFIAPFFYSLLQGHGTKRDTLSFVVFLPFFILSYSRSAYLSLIITIISIFFLQWNRIKLQKLYLALMTMFVAIMSILFVSTTVEVRDITILRPIHEHLTTHYDLNYKTFLSRRDQYLFTSFEAVKERAVGYGPGNYRFVSEYYSNNSYTVTETSHNIFLDILVENGVVAGVSFMLLLVWLFAVSNKSNPLFFAALALLVNFQTDYTFRIYSLLVLFFVLLALLIQPKVTQELRLRSFTIGLWIVVGMVWAISQAMIVSGKFF